MTEATRHCRLLILGSGPAGYTAAVYAARANLKPVLITGMAQGGQLMTTTDVDNWPADAHGVQGPELMQRFEEHARRFETEIIFDHIHTATDRKALHADRRLGHLHLRRADHRHRRVGAVPRPAVRRGIRRTRRFRLRDLRRFLLPRTAGGRHRRRQYRRRGSAVSGQHRQPRHPGASPRQAAQRENPAGQAVRQGKGRQGHIRWNCTLDEVLGDQSGVTGMRIKGQADRRAPKTCPLMGVFIAIGHKPNTELFAGQLDDGRRLPDHPGGRQGNATATSIAGVFRRRRRAGPHLSPGVHLAGSGCMAALDAERYLDSLGLAG
jgi:thioredoxin reductase (NADPH)